MHTVASIEQYWPDIQTVTWLVRCQYPKDQQACSQIGFKEVDFHEQCTVDLAACLSAFLEM